MKKLIATVIAALMILTAFIGCGTPAATQTDSSKQEAKTETEAAKTESAAEKKDVSLTFTYWGSPIEKQEIEKAMKDFEAANPGIKVTPMHIPTDYNTKITTMMAGNEAPDVGYMNELAFPWAKEGKIVNVIDKIEADSDLNVDDFLPDAFYMYEPGKSLGVMPAVEPFALFYNKDMFTEANVELPPTSAETAWDWDKFVDIAKQLTLDNKGVNAADPAFDATNITQYGVQFDTWWGPWLNMVYSNGGDYITPDGEYKLDQPAATDALQKMADLVNVHHVAPSPVQAKNIPAPAVALQSKKVAMTLNGQWILLDLGQTSGLNFDIGVLPKMKENVTLVQGGVICAFTTSKYPEEAWKLWKFLNDPEAVLGLHAGGLWMPAKKSWYTDEALLDKWARNNPAHPAGFMGSVVDMALKNGKAAPVSTVPNFGKVDALVSPALDQVWLGKTTAAEALSEITPKVLAELKN